MSLFTEYRDVQVSVDSQSEGIAASLRLPAPALDAWRAVTEPPQVRSWLGTLWGPLVVGASPRLDFGDGDFFSLDVRRVEEPRLVEYDWRFLGIAPASTITWTIVPLDDCESEVTVIDRQRGRGRGETLELAGGWADFCTRLGRFVATGAWSRYAWRDEIDASIAVRARVEVVSSLLDESRRGRWLPSFAKLRVLRAERTAPERLELTIGRDDWTAHTIAVVQARPRRGQTLLSVHHQGFRTLPVEEGRQRLIRQAAVAEWIRSLEAAAATGASAG
jgi:uncharacterized protein YndB with AHSA1/START domain